MKEIWVPISGAIARQNQIDVIANNIANGNTSGFKKDDITFKEHLTALEKGNDNIDIPNKEFSPDDFYRSNGAEHSFVKTAGTYTDFSQGQLTPSNNPLDLAISGKGFFSILTPNGVRFSRNGTFALANDGTLVNAHGHPVISSITPDSKPTLVKLPLNAKASINLQGEIFNGEERIGQLKITEFSDPASLIKEGNGFFINRDPNNILPESQKSQVLQGFVEQSNVSTVEEMTKLIRASRNLESIQRVIKTYDTISGKSTNELLRF